MFEHTKNGEDSYRFKVYVYVYGSGQDFGKVEHEVCLVLFFRIKFFQDLELGTSMALMSIYHKDQQAEDMVILIMSSKGTQVIA